jgi:hypothetical protein
MKQIKAFVLVLVLMTSIVSLAVADEAGDNYQGSQGNGKGSDHQRNETAPRQNHSFENETEHELEIMNTTLGSEIRLLQLEKSILINLLKGLMTVQVLKGLELEVNTSSLEVILADLRDVLVNVRDADPGANDSVQVFIELKNTSRALTKEFRDTLQVLVTNETIAEIKEQLRNITSNELQNCSMKLRSRIRLYNRNQLYRLYGIIGETNNTFINEYLNGTINLSQVKFQLHKLINQMTKEKREMMFSEFKEENIKKKIRSHTSMNEFEHPGNGYGHGDEH